MISQYETIFVYEKGCEHMASEHKPTLRVLSVLEQVSAGTGKYTLSELSRSLDIPVSTLFPIVRTLREHQYLDYDQAAQTYSLGYRLFEIGSRIQNTNAYESLVEMMWKIVDGCGETCHFGILDRGDVLYLAKVDPKQQPIRMYSMIGRRLAAYGTGIGKALLRDFTLEQLRETYPGGLRPLTAHTVTDFSELYRQLQEIKATGFAYENEESNESVRCIAVPVESGGRVAAALSVAMPVFRYDDRKKRCAEQLLRDAAGYAEKIVPHLHF